MHTHYHIRPYVLGNRLLTHSIFINQLEQLWLAPVILRKWQFDIFWGNQSQLDAPEHLFLFDAGANPHLLDIIMSNWSGTCVVHCAFSYRLYVLRWKMIWTILFSVSLKRSRLQNYIRIWMILWVPWFYFLFVSFSCIPRVQLWVPSQKPKNEIYSNIARDHDLASWFFFQVGLYHSHIIMFMTVLHGNF